MFSEIDTAKETLERTDATLFEIETGQLEVTEEEWKKLKALGNALVMRLADYVSALTLQSKEEVTVDFEKIRTLNRLQMTAERFLQLYPESTPQADELIRRIFDADNPIPKEKLDEEWNSQFGFMFIERPRAKRSFLKRLLKRG